MDLFSSTGAEFTVLKDGVKGAEDDWSRMKMLAGFVDQQAPAEFGGLPDLEKACRMGDWVRDTVGDYVEAFRLLWKAAADYWDPFPAHRASLLDCATALYREEMTEGGNGL